MKNLIYQKIEYFLTIVKKYSSAILFVLGSIIFIIGAIFSLSDFYFRFSSIFGGLGKALVGVVLLKIVDEVMLYKINTNDVLKKDSKAYSLYMLGYAIIIALAFATS